MFLAIVVMDLHTGWIVSYRNIKEKLHKIHRALIKYLVWNGLSDNKSIFHTETRHCTRRIVDVVIEIITNYNYFNRIMLYITLNAASNAL